MNVLNFLPTAAVECTTLCYFQSLKPNFTRVQFGRNGRVHSESRCNHCGFRITGRDSESFDNEEQAHASDCRGSEAE
jgi:hypothetical protein